MKEVIHVFTVTGTVLGVTTWTDLDVKLRCFLTTLTAAWLIRKWYRSYKKKDDKDIKDVVHDSYVDPDTDL